MVRSHRNSICDTCVQISRSFEFFDNFAYIVVISRKTVKSAKNTIFDADLTVYGLLQLYKQNCQKTHNSARSVHKYHKSSSNVIWPFYGLF